MQLCRAKRHSETRTAREEASRRSMAPTSSMALSASEGSPPTDASIATQLPGGASATASPPSPACKRKPSSPLG